jgi:hypothetical protein
LLFSFLPNYFRLKEDLLHVLLVRHDGKALGPFIIKARKKETALRVFGANGLKISEINA